MMEFIKAVILGILQGITEWLPISSTAHLILLNNIIKLDVSVAFWDLFEVVIQLGSILAVVLLYFNKLNPLSKDKTKQQQESTYRLWFMIVIASIPLVIGALLDDYIPKHNLVIAATLIIYGVGFILIEKRNKNKPSKFSTVANIDVKTAFLIGLFQLLAIVPGTSRSGATIIGALILGVSRVAATEFSFFLAIPAMFGASGLKLIKYIMETGFIFTGFEVFILTTATVVSFVVSVFAIKYLLKYIRRNDFTAFGYYRIVLGIVIILVFGVQLIFA